MRMCILILFCLYQSKERKKNALLIVIYHHSPTILSFFDSSNLWIPSNSRFSRETLIELARFQREKKKAQASLGYTLATRISINLDQQEK